MPSVGSRAMIRCLETRISDHKALWISASLSFDRSLSSSAMPARHLGCPQEVAVEDWRRALKTILMVFVWFGVALLKSNGRSFARLWRVACTAPLASFLRKDPYSPPTRPKGSLPEVILSDSTKTPKPLEEPARILALNNFLGRLLEAQRAARRRDGIPESLQQAIFRSWPQDVPRSTFEDATAYTEHSIHLLRQRRRQHGLSTWKQKVMSGGRAATRWLKNKACLLPPALSLTIDDNTFTSRTVGQSLQFLQQLWKRVWRRPIPHDLVSSSEERWQNSPPPTASWGDAVFPLSAEELLARARVKHDGGAGPDGFTGEEISHLPLLAVVCRAPSMLASSSRFPRGMAPRAHGLHP